MHSHGSALAHQCLCQVVADTEFIDSVARLVDHGEQGTVHMVVVMGRNSYVMIVQIRRKWMSTDCQHTLIKIKAYVLCQKFRQLSLILFRIISCQEGVFNLLSTFPDLTDQGNNGLFQLIKELIKQFHVKVLLV